MTDANQTPTPDTETSAIVETPSTEDTKSTDELRQETEALIEAIRRRAQHEAQSAGEMTREAYLNAVRQVRESVEHSKLFDQEQV